MSVGTSAPGCSVFGGSCSRFAGIVRVVSEGTLVLAGEAAWSNGGWLVDGTVENRGRLRIIGNERASAALNGLGLVRNLPGATITRATSAGQAEFALPLDPGAHNCFPTAPVAPATNTRITGCFVVPVNVRRRALTPRDLRRTAIQL